MQAEELRARRKRIRDFLWKINKTQVRIAEEYGITRAAVASFANGSRPNNPDVIAVFASLGYHDRRRKDGSLSNGPPIIRKRQLTVELRGAIG